MVKRIKTQRRFCPLVNCFSDSVASRSCPRQSYSGRSYSGRSYLWAALLATLVASSNAALAQTGPDNDADGIVNTSDHDDDNDGILDVNEGLIDADSDGVPDAGSADTDGDGTPDVLDLDSDNDGVLDNLETQTDRAAVDALDLNPNGAIDISFEVGANGIADAIETSADSGVLIFNLLDSDSDGIPDFRDNDSDNDGIFDLVEAGGVDADGNGLIDSFSDSDGKGVDDVVQASALPVFDTDGDGTLDFRDVDSDGDGIPDSVESGGSSIEGPVDTDADGAADYRETDSDDDGVSDSVEAGSNPSEPTDSNGDGHPDFQDAGVQNDAGSGSDTDGDTGDDTGGQTDDGASETESTTDGDDASGADDTGSTDGSDTTGDNNDGASDGTDADAGNDAGTADAGNTAADGGSTTDGSSDAVAQDDDVIDGPDIDGDGVPNQIDIDDDNDGIPDVLEGLVDEDNDGIADEDSRDSDDDGTPDGWDLDSDNDGVLDNREGHPDAEIVSELDQIADGAVDIGLEVGDNGLADVLETAPDSGQINYPLQDNDGDGIADLIDLDSDNDGILDITEAGGIDIDDDNDGRIDNFIDADDKGVDDAIQASALPIFDTDGDGVDDYRDSDSDGDGIPDSVEAGSMPTMPVDTDGDGAADFREQDADGDSVPDFAEVGADPANPIDSDGDGVPDFQDSAVSTGAPIADPVSDDVDNDGVVNDLDLDDDNDGILDSIEGDGDSDFDTTADRFDLDSDNDGVTDLTEAAELIETVLALDLDNDGRLNASVGENGIADELESTPDSGTSIFTLADSDADGIPDFQDLDSDNDGIYDAYESGRVATDINGRLIEASDSNGLVPSASNALRDTDGDGIVDNRDLDSDNDGLVDLLEASGPDSNGDGRIDEFDDSNGDGADDGLQSVASVVIDTDADRVPDYLDLDSDQDSLSDLLESLGNAEDLDNNGVLDNFDDGNFDGLDDDLAADPVLLRDTDRDGKPDQVDLDSDGDGFSDLVEAGGPDIDNDGIVDRLVDADNDAIPDSVDASVTGGEDSDQDGIDNMFDVDSIGGNDTDGDGIADDFDPDKDGNGFVGPDEETGQGVALALPDSDGDGVADVVQADPAAGDGLIETGLDGNGFGCTVSSVNFSAQSGSAPKATDPLLLMLLMASFASLLWRAAVRIKNRLSAKAKSVRRAGLLFAAVSSLALSGCNILIPGGLSENRGGDRGGDAHKGRVYLGAGALVSELKPNADKPDGFSVDETQSAGGSVQLGYDISNRFSLELHGSELGEATFEPSGSIGYQVGGLSALIYGLNDRDRRGRREGFSVFGRVGAGTMRNQGDGVMFERLNDYHALGGLGLEYGFRNGLAVRGEVVAHETDARYGQLGLLYRFGSAGATKARSPSPRIEVPAQPEVEVEAAPAPEPTESVPLDAGAPLDSDADGVFDDVDSCPNSQPGLPVGDTGCALFNGTIEGINFESGSDKLTASAEQILAGVAGTLNDFPDVRVAIDAHTDNQGSAESNLQLSKRRAIAVARYLVEQGVSGPRLQPRAYGESQPRETNATAAGRARNRRVEFQVVQ